MKLVDTLEEQALLERVLDDSKPPVPPDCQHLHYLLSTPFRYGAPYPSGSRFRRAGMTPGVFYASQTVATAVSEMAFARLVFFAESPATPWPANASEHTAFAARVRTSKALDLSRPPFDAQRERWTDPTRYEDCQALAEAARMAGIQAIRYPSARDSSGRNLAVLTCTAFASKAPEERQSWRLHFDRTGVRAICDFPPQRLAFDRGAFSRDPRVRALSWER